MGVFHDTPFARIKKRKYHR